MSYAHPVFISYKHSATMDYWLPEYFVPCFQEWLDQALAVHPYKGRIFRDEAAIEPGDYWRQKIATSLNRSCVLLTFCSPEYFTSRVCWAEWLTFRRRESAMQVKESGLVVPVLACEGEGIPREAKDTQWADLSKFVTKSHGFASSRRFLSFEDEVKELARKVAKRVMNSPAFNPDWTAIDFEDASINERMKGSTQPLPFPSLAA